MLAILVVVAVAVVAAAAFVLENINKALQTIDNKTIDKYEEKKKEKKMKTY